MGNPTSKARNLTDLVKIIGKETHTMTAGGEMLSKDEFLIRQLWDLALGYTEKTKGDNGKEKEIKHKPQKWAMQEIISRREGGIAQVMPDSAKNRITAAKQVRDMAKNRLNKLAERLKEKDGE